LGDCGGCCCCVCNSLVGLFGASVLPKAEKDRCACRLLLDGPADKPPRLADDD
jgi:hypothetical protein